MRRFGWGGERISLEILSETAINFRNIQLENTSNMSFQRQVVTFHHRRAFYFSLLSSSSCAHCSEIQNVEAGHLNLEAKGVKAISDFVGLSVAVRVWAVLQFLFLLYLLLHENGENVKMITSD